MATSSFLLFPCFLLFLTFISCFISHAHGSFNYFFFFIPILPFALPFSNFAYCSLYYSSVIMPIPSLLLLLFFSPSFAILNFHQPFFSLLRSAMLIFSFNFCVHSFPIIEPDPTHTKLRISSEGLESIKRITNPIASVAVIGPYRSGKSFLLNQLLSLSCYEGFGVGHMRDTKTKGIWVWGTPIELDIDGVRTSVFYLDTEGFESLGKSNVYDDRIFALATIMSSVLIYNLPETIREADISRLSFAVELAEEFYGRFAT
ncbi:hypothetical protein Ahy_A02g008854 [Arachis hypogaea]|uniref:GB1/RHD3-type G domain-containing protein n=1 Tax=Arachis hypogaea TaxID=3818 RepID=A0A445EFC4_ARAHY|nr:hypothetical protein Ahy_A02g008854 [Arachis hypogaea]